MVRTAHRLSRKVLLQVSQEVAVGCPFGLHLKTRQSWIYAVVRSRDWSCCWELSWGCQPGSLHPAFPCGFAQRSGAVPQESILRANVSRGSGRSWKDSCDPASEITQSPSHQTPWVQSKFQAIPDSRAADHTGAEYYSVAQGGVIFTAHGGGDDGSGSSRFDIKVVMVVSVSQVAVMAVAAWC